VSQLEQFPETTEIDITSEEKKWKQNKLIMIEIIIKLI
jgi:hypothetical protein